MLIERALYAIVVVNNSNNHDNFLTSDVSYLIHRVGPTEITQNDASNTYIILQGAVIFILPNNMSVKFSPKFWDLLAAI